MAMLSKWQHMCSHLVCVNDSSTHRLGTSVGEDNIPQMILELSAVADECIAEATDNQTKEMRKKDDFDYENANTKIKQYKPYAFD